MRGDIEALAWLHSHGESMQAMAADTGQHPAHFAAAAKSLDALVWLASRESLPRLHTHNRFDALLRSCHRILV
jgi:hypothetical protein